HEISTPLGVATTGSSYLLKQIKRIKKSMYEAKLSKMDLVNFIKKAEEVSETLENNLLRAIELIKSFKQVSVDQSNLNIRTFSFKKYIYEIIINLKQELKKIDNEIIVDSPENLNLLSIPGIFSQIITNFIMNSIIHGYIEGNKLIINIKVKIVEDEILITYSDNGKGIENENIPKIFDSFFTTNRENGGSGLGLNIVYDLVTQELGGKIDCESEIHKGTKFTITFKKSDKINWIFIET
ncbi:HAMP domain-containing sensor histidine kinase, partial [Clostridiaceae bacterium HSG29]|nr:HAMP domain-containing sensor histidine kinase [Clostridiaceae bacterium HSG29]